MTARLRAEGIVARLGRRTVLDGVDVEVRAGEVLALVGPNGAGKSTLLRVLSGDLSPVQGRVSFDGRPLASWSARALARRRAVLTQNASVGAAFTLDEVVRLGRHPHRTRASVDDAIVRSALTRVGLLDRAGDRWTQLSGGEQQRVAMARALAQIEDGDDGVLLLDEPTSALDLAWQQRALGLARDAAERGHAVVAVLHDLALASVFADRALLLHQGRCLASGPPADVLTPDALARAYAVRAHWVDVPELGAVPVVLGAHTHPTLEVR